MGSKADALMAALSIIEQDTREYVKIRDERDALRAERVKLQGEIERLTHENMELRENGETLLDAVDRAEAKQTDIEALAERLAKVEDRLSASVSNVTYDRKRIDALVTSTLNADNELRRRLDEFESLRHDLHDIVERLTALVERQAKAIAEVEQRLANLQYQVIVELGEQVEALAARLGRLDGQHTAFPTGAATTVEEVLEQVEEVLEQADIEMPISEQQAFVDDGPPRRGDRVRLEGARTTIAKTHIVDGWYDVVGHTDGEFEIIAMRYADGGHLLAWVPPGDHVKEVWRGAAKLVE